MKCLLITGFLLLTSTICFAEDYTLIPAKRVGKITLGMSRAEVLAADPNPAKVNQGSIVYKHEEPYSLLVYFNDQGHVQSLHFCSPKYTTKEGIQTNTFFLPKYRKYFKISTHRKKTFYEYKQGGLMFEVFEEPYCGSVY